MIKTFGSLTGHFNAPARGGAASSLIVIMHGWGADADDLADLATDELLEILEAKTMTENDAEALIMRARAHWFENETNENEESAASDASDEEASVAQAS